ncbi:MAG: PAS domain S-box protein [Flammeovirgaceae bacterium]
MDSKHLKTILDNNDSVIWMLNTNYELLQFNQAFSHWFREIYGLEANPGDSLMDLPYTIDNSEIEKWRVRYNEVLTHQKAKHFTDKYVVGGSQYLISINMFPVITNGMVEGITVFSRNITTQILEEQALEESGGQFKQLVEGSDVIFWIWNKERVTYVNPAYEDIFGRPRSILYKDQSSFVEWIHPNDYERVKKALNSEDYLLRGAFRDEFRIIRPDGQVRWLLARTFPMRDDTELKRVLGIAEDITEKKRIELAKRKLHTQFKSILESTEDIVFALDLSLRYTAFNQKHVAYMKETYNKDIELGKSILHYIDMGHPDATTIKKDLERALRGEQFTIDHIYGTGANKTFAEVRLNPMYDEQQNIVGLSVFVRDVTRRKIAESKMRRNQQLLSSINRNINEAIFRSSVDQGLIYINQAFVEMFGYNSKAEVFLIDPRQLYANPDDRKALMHQEMEDGAVENVEVLFRRKNGETFLGLLNSTRTIDEDGNLFFDGAVRDITKLKDAQEQLEYSNAELMRINKELDKFVYTASHDLKAPLSSIAGLINIYRDEDDETKRAHYLDLMERSVHKLKNFIREIVYYSRNSRLEVKSEPIDIRQFVQGIFDDLFYLNNSEKINKQFEIKRNGAFCTDRNRLEAILKNLISNAINYSDTRKPDPFIKVCVEIGAKEVYIQVTDNGIGIAEENLPKIFEMFFRESNDGDGSGLGLYIVSEALEKLKGTIDVSSKTRVGTTFKLTVPNLI